MNVATYITSNQLRNKLLESNLIGIFGINCEIEENGFYLDKSINIEVVVGRIKVDENLLVNVGMSVGLGLALLIMGMEIETEQVLEVVKYVTKNLD